LAQAVSDQAPPLGQQRQRQGRRDERRGWRCLAHMCLASAAFGTGRPCLLPAALHRPPASLRRRHREGARHRLRSPSRSLNLRLQPLRHRCTRRQHRRLRPLGRWRGRRQRALVAPRSRWLCGLVHTDWEGGRCYLVLQQAGRWHTLWPGLRGHQRRLAAAHRRYNQPETSSADATDSGGSP